MGFFSFVRLGLARAGLCALAIGPAALAQDRPAAGIWDGAVGVGIDLETLEVAGAPVSGGETWLQADMVFERQGVLVEDFTYDRERQSDLEFAAGHPAYARMIERGNETSLAWCLPRAEIVTDIFATAAICVTASGDDRGYAFRAWVEDEPLTLPDIRGTRQRVRLPQIELADRPLPPAFHLQLEFLGADADVVRLRLRHQTDGSGAGEPRAPATDMALPRQPDGSAYFRRQGGLWRLTPTSDDRLQVEPLGAPVPNQVYIEDFRAYLTFMQLRTGSLAWLARHPAMPSYNEMAMNGFIPGETDPADGLNLSGTALAPPVGALPDLALSQADSLADAEDMPEDRAIRAAGPVTVDAGHFADRAAFVRLPVAYVQTGTLDSEVRRRGWLGPDPLPAGTPVYGITNRYFGAGLTGGNPQTVWCAPRRDGDGFDSVCLLPINGGIWQQSRRAFFPPPRFSYTMDDGLREPFTVTEGPVDLGYELELTVSLLEWDGRDAEVRVELCAAIECETVRQLSLDHVSEDVIELRTFGHHLRLMRPENADRHVAEVEILAFPGEGYDLSNYPSVLAQSLQSVRH